MPTDLPGLNYVVLSEMFTPSAEFRCGERPSGCQDRGDPMIDYISRPFTSQKATLSARALIVREGFTETADGTSEPSATTRLG